MATTSFPIPSTKEQFLLTAQVHNNVTKCMEQSASLEGNNHSTSQEIARLLWNPKAYYSVHKNITTQWIQNNKLNYNSITNNSWQMM